MMKNDKKNIKKKQSKVGFKKKLHKKIEKTLMKKLGWNKSIAHFTGSLIIGLLSISGVWHKKLAQTMDTKNQMESDIRAIQRFFGRSYINYYFFSLMLYEMLGIKGKVTIILDRTNWKYGEKPINIFVAAALCQYPGLDQGSAVPLIWEVLNKDGTSNMHDRKKLMQKLIDVVGKENIEVVLADREFIGKEWIQFLHEQGIPFIIRIRNTMYVEHDEKRVNAMGLFSAIRYKEKLKYSVKINEIPVQLAATRSIEGELVVVIVSMDVTDDPLNQYRLRWLIELLFKSIKSRGFNLEETHMTNPERIKMLFALIALATLLTVQAGVIHHRFKKIPIKNHGRPTYSIFTYGLDFLRTLFRGTVPNFCKNLYDLFLQPPNFCPTLRQSENLVCALGKG